MIVAYLAHPLGAGPDREQNIRRAMRWGAWVASHGIAVVADWVWLAQVWTETPENRRRGLEIDCRLVEVCDVVLWCGGRVSDGMRVEGHHADMHRVPVLDLTALGEEPPPQFDFPLLARVRAALARAVCSTCLGRPPIDGCPSCLMPAQPEELSAPGIPAPGQPAQKERGRG